jgi:SOS-response transcriptional repressor LexA
MQERLSMTSEAERYISILKKSGLSKKDFAASLGLSPSMSYQITSGRIKLPRDLMDTLSKLYNVNLHWYLTGKGNPSLSSDETVDIELIEQEAAAGRGVEVEEYAEKAWFQILRSIVSPHNPHDLKAVYVKGDSMIDEHINDGDVVIFHPKRTEGNGIYVVSVGNTLLVKRVDFDPTNAVITLISANPAYEPRVFQGEELESIRIAGRVIATYHRV